MSKYPQQYEIFDILADTMIARQAEWRQRAACRDQDNKPWYPTSGDITVYGPALDICATCPVQEECKEDWIKMPVAMKHHGIWFGTTDLERKAMGLYDKKKANLATRPGGLTDKAPAF